VSPRALPRLLLLAPAFVLPACARRDEPKPSPAATTSASATAPVDPCAGAKSGLDDFIATLDATCSTDADCGGYFLREDTCVAPSMLHVPGCPPERKSLLFAHQADVRKSCEGGGPACAPAAYAAACRGGRCVNALAK
jgi:hypothetical protein